METTYVFEIFSVFFAFLTLVMFILWWTKRQEEERNQTNFEEERKYFSLHNKAIQEENKGLQQDKDSLLKRVIIFESQKSEREKEFLQKVENLEVSRNAFDQERKRVICEEEIKKKREEQLQSRQWNEHENTVLEELKKICKMPETNFLWYDNTSLPLEFDGSIRPDFLLEFLGQYIVFDAKKSRNPKSYIESQIKSTAKKYKEYREIYTTIFFVLPPEEIAQLSQKFFQEERFSFCIISPESIASILYLFKKITEYKNIKNFDPQDREAIVSLFAQYDKHISFQNAANIVLAQKSIDLMDSKKILPNTLQDEIIMKHKRLKDIRLTPSEIKKFSTSSDLQKETITKLINPQVSISSSDIKSAQNIGN